MKKILFFLFLPLIVFSNLELESEDAFWKEIKQRGTPIVEEIPEDEDHVKVTFFWRGSENTKNVGLYGTLWMEPKKCQLENIPGTSIWTKSFVLEKDFRGVYFFSPNDPVETFPDSKEKFYAFLNLLKSDPYNPKKYRISCFAPKFSEIELPNAKKQPNIFPRDDTPKGKVIQHDFVSSILGNERTIQIYLPHGYCEENSPYPLLIVFDGDAYTRIVPTPTILDNMIAEEKIPPVVAVFIDNASGQRSKELPCNPLFAKFLVEELLPWLHERYSLSKVEKNVVLAGSSYGGLAAAYIAYCYPQIFGNVLSQSGAFWYKPEGLEEYGWLVKEFAKADYLPIRFYMDVGKHENFSLWGQPDILSMNRELRDLLLKKGNEVTYVEFNGGHEYAWWRITLADGLEALLGQKFKAANLSAMQ